MLTEIEGTWNSKDVFDGISVLEATARQRITSVGIDWRSTRAGTDIKPAIVIRQEMAESRQARRRCEAGSSFRLMLHVGSEPGRPRSARADVLARVALRKRRRHRTYGGLPWVAKMSGLASEGSRLSQKSMADPRRSRYKKSPAY